MQSSIPPSSSMLPHWSWDVVGIFTFFAIVLWRMLSWVFGLAFQRYITEAIEKEGRKTRRVFRRRYKVLESRLQAIEAAIPRTRNPLLLRESDFHIDPQDLLADPDRGPA